MKRAISLALAGLAFVVLTGCVTQHGRRPLECMGGSCAQAPENCRQCDDPNGNGYGDPGRLFCRACRGHGCPLCCGRRGGGEEVNPGPATGAITYPYYTNRGPRDFLAKNPASIGP